MRRLFALAPALCLAALLTACAGNPFGAAQVPPGTPRQQVVERLGPPGRIVPLSGGGERLQYSMQPFGQAAWMVDLDAAGRVVSARQVLTEADFHRIEPGKWSREDVEREFGRPALIDSVSSWNGPILTYRWRDRQGSDMFYYVYLDPGNVVRRAHPGMDFINAPNDRN